MGHGVNAVRLQALHKSLFKISNSCMKTQFETSKNRPYTKAKFHAAVPLKISKDMLQSYEISAAWRLRTCDTIKLVEKRPHPTIQTGACCACALHSNYIYKRQMVIFPTRTCQCKPVSSGLAGILHIDLHISPVDNTCKSGQGSRPCLSLSSYSKRVCIWNIALPLMGQLTRESNTSKRYDKNNPCKV